jgi:hypothetical protein
MAKPQKQDASALSKTLAGQWSKSEKRAVASRSIMDSKIAAHKAVKAVKLARQLAK